MHLIHANLSLLASPLRNSQVEPTLNGHEERPASTRSRWKVFETAREDLRRDATAAGFKIDQHTRRKGRLYVAAGLKDHQPAHLRLVGKMSDNVTVAVVEKDGGQMIYIDTVK